MQAVVTMVSRLVETDDGQDLVEYGLLVVLIALVAIAGVSYLGDVIYTILWEPLANAI